MATIIMFRNKIPHIEGKPVRNVRYLMELFQKHQPERKEFEDSVFPMQIQYRICPLHWVPDGDYVTVIGDELDKNIANRICNCGVSFDMHGTCCGFENAKTAIDENGRICDDRHPWYNRNYNDWINERLK